MSEETGLTLATIAAFLMAVAAVSRLPERSVLTLPILYVTAGLIVGSEGFGLIGLSIESEGVKLLAEVTLALVLFADGSRINVLSLRREYSVPARLLGIGLPLTIAAGVAAGAGLFDELPLAEILIIAIILAPTDAALGKAVVTDRRLPSRIRQGLNVESGLNDGICVPLLLIAVAYAEADAGHMTGVDALTLILEQIGFGVVGGVVAGLAAVVLSRWGAQRQLIAPAWAQILPLGAVGLSYGIALGLGGSGFVAAFVGGLVFGALRERRGGEVTYLVDESGELLTALTFLLFGAAVLGPALNDITWQTALYAALSLTAIRMLPVAVSMIGSRAHPWTLAYLGWFGPRGLASIVFLTTVVGDASLAHFDTIRVAVVLTIGLSVYAHGLTARPGTDRYVRWYESQPGDRPPPMESVEAADLPWREPTATPVAFKGEVPPKV